MQKLEQMINIYHTAFIIFLVLTILFLLLSIFLFFKLNIREIYDMRTGRGARRKIQEMEEINERTGKLRDEVVQKNYDAPEYDIMPQSKSEPLQEMKHKVTYQEGGRAAASVDRSPVVEVVSGMEETSLLNDESATTLLSDESATTLLSDESQTTLLSDDSQTTLLSGDSQITLLSGESETSVLDNHELTENEGTSQLERGSVSEEKEEKVGTFNIEKEVMLIHTDEIL